MTKRAFLSAEELSAALDSLPSGQVVSVVRIRYKNRNPIRTNESFRVEDFRAFVTTCLEERHQPGGDLELAIPALGKTLVGHHDGLYWLEDSPRLDR